MKDGAEAATAFLRGRGFLDARVAAITSPWDPASNRVDVELRVVEGPEYTVEFRGNQALGDRALARRADLAELGPIDTFVLDTAARAIEAAYRERGYAFAQATATMDERDGVRHIRFEVQEGPRDDRGRGGDHREPPDSRRRAGEAHEAPARALVLHAVPGRICWTPTSAPCGPICARRASRRPRWGRPA